MTRFGLIARIALLVGCVEVVAFGTLGWFYVDRFSAAADQRLRARLELVGKMIAGEELAVSVVSRQTMLSGLLGAPYLSGLVISSNGRVIVATDAASLGRMASSVQGFNPRWLAGRTATERFFPGADSLTGVTHIYSPGTGASIYHVVLTVSTARLEANKRGIALWGLAGSVFFILFSSAVIVFIAQRFLTRRVDGSLTVLKRVEGGDLGARIPVSTNDELGQLQLGINSMTEKIGTLLAQHRHNEEQLDAILNAISDGVIAIGLDGEVQRCNPAAENFLGHCSDGEPVLHVIEAIPELPWVGSWWQSEESLTAFERVSFLRPGPDGAMRSFELGHDPIKDIDGRVLGAVLVLQDVTARKQAEERIRHLAYFDPLTNLPNRRLFTDRLHHAMASGDRDRQYGALLILDLDNFKELNDTQGHDVGDRLLIEVARRLKESVRQADTVARLGGDEYIVVCDSLSGDEASAAVQAEAIANKIQLSINQPYLLKPGESAYYCTPSIGLTLFQGEDTSSEVLLKQADVALYQAKDAGRNTVRFFNTDMQSAIDQRARMALGLRNGMQRDEFRLYYQSQVDRDRRLIGAEALLRWLPANGAPVPPAEFIPLAEETGLILGIGEWVLEQACQQLRRWQADERSRGLTLAINVSARQFHQADFVDRVVHHVDRAGIDPAKLKLELTESVVLSGVDEVIDRMQKLKAVGVGFSLDDFGTGFSSLSYLKRLPLDQIKIDQSFVRDIMHDQNDAAIVRAILAISETLGLRVIAEGVETEAQRALLIDYGCEDFQGYLFGKPAPIEDWPAS